jgi:hypothetical protein
VPVAGRASQVRQLRCCLTVWFAALLAIAPFVRPSLPVDVAAGPAAPVDSLVAQDGTDQAKHPATGPRPAQPLMLGILSRPSVLETTLGLPPPKPALLRLSAADQPLLARQVATALGGDRKVLQRSSVGTARAPTGPPV